MAYETSYTTEGFVGPSSMPPPLPITRNSHRPQDWEDRRSTIKQLYTTEGRTLREVRDIMEQKYGFLATYIIPLFSDSFSSLLALTRRNRRTDNLLGSVNTREEYRSGAWTKRSRA